MILTIYGICVFAQAASASEIAHVVTPVAPLLPILTEIMRGAGAPSLIKSAAQNPHNAHLSVSDAQAISKANAIIVADISMNKNLYETIQKRAAKDAKIISLTRLKGANPLPYRRNNPLTNFHAIAKHEAEHAQVKKYTPSEVIYPSTIKKKPHAHSHTHEHEKNTASIDPHIWLDPIRMAQLLPALAEQLGEIEPEHAATFADNAKRLSEHLREEVSPALASLFAHIRPAQTKDVIPYVTYHDAYQYFDARYGLTQHGFITQRPEEYVGAASMKALLEATNTTKIRCIIAESNGPLTRNLAVRSEAAVVILSPERAYASSELPSASWARNNYDRLLYKIAETFVGCIEGRDS